MLTLVRETQGPAPLTPPRPQPHNVHTDMPAGLTDREREAYMSGYSRGCHTFVRKHGGAGVTLEAGQTVSIEELQARALAHEAERQPAAHRAGMSELRRWLKKYATEERAAEILKPAKPAAVKPAARKPRKAAAAKPAPVVETVPTPVASEAPRAPMTFAARKASRRELAARLRAQGIKPAGEAWETAKREAGLAFAEAAR